MSTMQKRAKARREKIKLNIVALHSDSHHSFHTHLDDKQSWELLARMSKEAWLEQTGKIADDFVDKSHVVFKTLN